MKKIVFTAVFLLFAVVSFAEEKVGSYTMHGTSYDVEAGINSKGNLVTFIQIMGKYKSDKIMMNIESEEDLLLFVRSLERTKSKFIEWKNVAKKNNVKDFIKEMDIVYPKVQICWLGVTEWNFSYKDDYIKMRFIVNEDGFIYFGAGGDANSWDNEYIKQEWFMIFYNIDEIQSLIDALNIQTIKENLNRTAKVESLFK